MAHQWSPLSTSMLSFVWSTQTEVNASLSAQSVPIRYTISANLSGEGRMLRLVTMRRAVRFAVVMILLVGFSSVKAAELDPKAINIQLPKEIKWVKQQGGGAEVATLVGDPSKPGLYIVLQKWLPHNNSRPHFHPNDRFITVLSGTWWVNTGPKYDMEHAKPVPAGSYVVHYGKEIHYDGAKDEECLLQIVGMGPATNTPAEQK